LPRRSPGAAGRADRRSDQRQLQAPVPQAMSRMHRTSARSVRRLVLRGMAAMALLGSGVGGPAGSRLAHAEDPRIDLLEAVRLDDADTVRRLLAESVSPNLREKTHGPAIVMAAKTGSFKSLAELAGAPGIDLEASDSSGQTALMMAAVKGHVPSVKLLLERGARVDTPDGWTALPSAASG